jgi:fucose permease
MLIFEKQRLSFLLYSCKEHFRAHPQLKLALFTFFIAGFQICLQGLFITEFSHALHTSTSKIIFLESVALTCCLISNYFSAYFINRFSAFNVLKISILLFIFGDIIFYIILAHTKTPVNFTWLSYILTLIITGLGLGLLYPSINHTILELNTTSVKKASTLTWLNAFWNIGYCISSLIASTTAAAHKPNIPFLILSTLFITLLIYLNKQTNLYQPQTNLITLQSKRRNRINFNDIPQQLLLVGCICLVITFTQNTVEYWFPAYLRIEHQKGMSMTAFAMSFFGLGQLLGRLFFGFWVIPKVNLTRFIIIMIAVLSSAISLFLFANPISITFLLIFIIGLSSSCLLPIMMNHDARRTACNHKASFLVLMNTLGSTISFWLTSLFSQFISIHYAIISAPILLLSALAAYFLLQTDYGKRRILASLR